MRADNGLNVSQDLNAHPLSRCDPVLDTGVGNLVAVAMAVRGRVFGLIEIAASPCSSQPATPITNPANPVGYPPAYDRYNCYTDTTNRLVSAGCQAAPVMINSGLLTKAGDGAGEGKSWFHCLER